MSEVERCWIVSLPLDLGLLAHRFNKPGVHTKGPQLKMDLDGEEDKDICNHGGAASRAGPM